MRACHHPTGKHVTNDTSHTSLEASDTHRGGITLLHRKDRNDEKTKPGSAADPKSPPAWEGGSGPLRLNRMRFPPHQDGTGI